MWREPSKDESKFEAPTGGMGASFASAIGCVTADKDVCERGI